jgi:hypothetical protein
MNADNDFEHLVKKKSFLKHCCKICDIIGRTRFRDFERVLQPYIQQ